MTEELRVAVDRKPNGAILYTKGYINNVGGEEIANRAYELMDGGVTTLLLNLRETKIVNSIGISILIEIIEKMIDRGGRIAFCCLTPVIHKTFQSRDRIFRCGAKISEVSDHDTAHRFL